MERDIAPLNGLRAFEAAARHLSFRKAAEELHVTPAAVSQQIKSLEAYLGVTLFRRLTRALLLTDAGQAAVPLLREGLDRLADATEVLRHHHRRDVLTVSVPISLGAKWLVPRIEEFHRRCPEFDVRIDTSNRLANFTRDGIDFGIRFGQGVYPGLRSDRLFGEELFPVCSPDLLRGEHPLRHPEDLKWHTLLHHEGSPTDAGLLDWSTWLSASGVEGVDGSRGPRFSSTVVMTEATKSGQGVSLGRSVLVEGDLASGALVRPFEQSSPAIFAYYAVTPQTATEAPKITAFRDWLQDAAARYVAESGWPENSAK